MEDWIVVYASEATAAQALEELKAAGRLGKGGLRVVRRQALESGQVLVTYGPARERPAEAAHGTD